MTPSISHTLLFCIAAGMGLAVLSWSIIRLKGLPAGPERDELRNGLWGKAAAVLLLLMVAASRPPLSISFEVMLATMLVVTGLMWTGYAKREGFAAARRLQLEEDEARASTLADRIAALEGQRLPHRPFGLRTHVAVAGGLLLYALSLWDIARSYDERLVTAVGSLWAVALLALWYGHSVAHRRTKRERIDLRIEALLGGVEAGRTKEG